MADLGQMWMLQAPRLFETVEAFLNRLRHRITQDEIIQFESDFFCLRPMLCGFHPKQTRLDLDT